MLGELRDLEAARDQLATDVDNLERHLEEQRDRVRLTTRELQRLLDDPAALREVAVPVLADVAVPVTSAPLEEPVAEAPVVDDGPTEWAPDESAWDEAVDTPMPAPSPAYAEPPAETGPDTEAVDVFAPRDPDDDAYLAELRKAMTDESPLGPRDEDPLFDADQPARSRFGRRR